MSKDVADCTYVFRRQGRKRGRVFFSYYEENPYGPPIACDDKLFSAETFTLSGTEVITKDGYDLITFVQATECYLEVEHDNTIQM